MNTSINLSAKFESTVRDLLVAMELGDVFKENCRGWTYTIGQKYAVAVEYYYASLPDSALVYESAATVARAAKRHCLHPVLIVSCELTEHQRSHIEERFDITLMDRADLIISANRFKSILGDLEILGLALASRIPQANKSRAVASMGPRKRSLLRMDTRHPVSRSIALG